jgi:hypothetical protein
MPRYSLTATSTTITFTIAPDGGYTYYRLFLRRSDSTDMIVSGTSVTAVGMPVQYTVYWLEPNTEYTANVYYSTDSTTLENIVMGAQSIKTNESERPSDWEWTTNFVSGASVPKYGESLAPVTAAEWNAFCETINEFREYKSLPAYSFTAVSRGTPMTAANLNQAIIAISAIPGHGTLPTVNVTSALFWQRLASALNAVS